MQVTVYVRNTEVYRVLGGTNRSGPLLSHKATRADQCQMVLTRGLGGLYIYAGRASWRPEDSVLDESM